MMLLSQNLCSTGGSYQKSLSTHHHFLTHLFSLVLFKLPDRIKRAFHRCCYPLTKSSWSPICGLVFNTFFFNFLLTVFTGGGPLR